MQIHKYLRIVYILIWVLLAAYAGLSEFDFVPTGFIQANPAEMYGWNVVGIIIMLSAIYISLRLFHFKAIRKYLIRKDGSLNASVYGKLSWFRLGFMTTSLFYDAILYYGTLNYQFIYCLLISLLAFVFCWPSPLDDDSEKKNDAAPSK